MARFIDPVTLSPTANDTWQDVDVSANAPAGTTGVIIHITATAFDSIGFRKNGSTDDRTGSSSLRNFHDWIAIGVDSGRIFEINLESGGTYIVKIVGYFGAEANFFDNATDKSTGTTGSWVDVDISGDTTGGDVATHAFYEVHVSTGTTGITQGCRVNGSTDAVMIWGLNGTIEHIDWGTIGCDGSEIFEQYTSHADGDLYLLGYATDGFTANTNATVVTPGSTGSWVDLTSLTETDVIGAAYMVSDTSISEPIGFRKNGSSEDIKEQPGSGCIAIVECDISGVIEGYKDASSFVTFYELGEFTSLLLIRNRLRACT